MGRLESLTAVSLGRGPYEKEVVEGTTDERGEKSSGQQYNEHGHPKNPETKRREREHVRAANEVMQVTGIVEDSIAAKAIATESLMSKNRDTLSGIRAMEYGRALLVGGIWGVLGLRRRILLYKPYSTIGFLGLLRYESHNFGPLKVARTGLPAQFAYHVADWIEFFGENVLDAFWEEEDENSNPIELPTGQLWWKGVIRTLWNAGLSWATLNFRLFAIHQQLNLIPASRFLPSFKSIMPFTTESPIQNPFFRPLRPISVLSWSLLVVFLYGRIKHAVVRQLYQPIYRLLPRPIGESMFLGLPIAPTMEYDTPDRASEDQSTSQDEPTLRALEGLPALERLEPRSRHNERDSDSGLEDDGEVTHTTLISFDVEASEPTETQLGTLGTWSAELRSANETKHPDCTKYRMTGLTLLPTILASEGLREIAAGIIVMPLEAFLVRIIGHTHRASTGLGTDDMFSLRSGVISLGITGSTNILSVLLVQLGVTGVVWIGFTACVQCWASWKDIKRNVLSRWQSIRTRTETN
ncbi:hypothetical protein BJ875DRAFT_73251 [Amylocarpus encephaloides]|uniref:Uncharacterized protein n=1 Tax=Amylocarpus encephaloides TaxID=45428 RepID=A0A9P7YF71_9HELO|nr:hypothetical protein BJ875DRAFT_73251 [Amylocarpus encephaloides]